MKTLYITNADDNSIKKLKLTYNKIEELKPQFSQIGIRIGNNIVIGNNVTINYNCDIKDNVTIGDNTYLGYGIRIAENIKIGNNCKIGYCNSICCDTTIKDNVVTGNSVHIGKNTIIGNKVKIGNKVCICSNVLIENKVKINDGLYIIRDSIIKSRVTVKEKRKSFKDKIMEKIPLNYIITLTIILLKIKIHIRHLIKYGKMGKVYIQKSPLSESMYLYYINPIWGNSDYTRNYIKIRVSGHKPTSKENSQIRVLI